MRFFTCHAHSVNGPVARKPFGAPRSNLKAGITGIRVSSIVQPGNNIIG
jgi:hypothetical protein